MYSLGKSGDPVCLVDTHFKGIIFKAQDLKMPCSEDLCSLKDFYVENDLVWTLGLFTQSPIPFVTCFELFWRSKVVLM